MLVLELAGIITAAFSVLLLHRTGVARALRIVGCAIYAAADAIDHWKVRLRTMRAELS